MKSYSELVTQIRDAVRKKAQEVPVFKKTGNGAIRILAYPLCKEADDWLGGLSDFSDPENPDIVDYEHTFAITAGGSRVITGVWDGVEQRVDCYAFSALKIAHCSRAQDLGAGLVSGIDLGNPYLTEDNGYGPYRGALLVEVSHKDLGDFCYGYVCVSGADSKDDLECAKAGTEAIKYFFQNEEAFRLKLPDYSVLD